MVRRRDDDDELMEAKGSIYNIIGDVRHAQIAERLTATSRPIEAVKKLCDMGLAYEAVSLLNKILAPAAIAGQFAAFTLLNPDRLPTACQVISGDEESAMYYIVVRERAGKYTDYTDVVCIALEKGPQTDPSSPKFYYRPCTLTEYTYITRSHITRGDEGGEAGRAQWE